MDNNCVIRGELCDPDGNIESIKVDIEEESLQRINNALSDMQSVVNATLTEKIEAQKCKEPSQKKPKKC